MNYMLIRTDFNQFHGNQMKIASPLLLKLQTKHTPTFSPNSLMYKRNFSTILSENLVKNEFSRTLKYRPSVLTSVSIDYFCTHIFRCILMLRHPYAVISK